MTQFPNEKDGRSDRLYPSQQSTPSFPLLDQNPPYSYTLRDGAPAPAQSAYAASSQSQYHAPPQPQGYYPPQGPPPDYGYAQSHPDQGRPSNDRNGPVPPNIYDVPTPAPQAGPLSSSAQDGQGGIMMSLGSFFGNSGPPPMWQRPPPQHLPYPAFPPMFLISNNKQLSSGFPELPPPCAFNPHPFATHDITEADWKRFLGDVKKAGSLSPSQRIRSNVIPLVTGMSFLTGFLATHLIEKKMKRKNRQAAGDLVDHWNHYFFGPRRMEAVLCQASERLSGKLGAAPVSDPYQQRIANGLRQRGPDDSSDDDSDSDEYDNHGHRHGHDQHGFGHGFGSQNNQGFDRQSRRARRRERRQDRRARRAERRERKSRGEYEEPYQLFITAI